MKAETKKHLIISLIIVLSVVFLVYGEEMASITVGNSTGYLTAAINQNITVSYNLAGHSSYAYCDVELSYQPENGTYLDSMVIGSFRHANPGSQLTGEFPAFSVSQAGNYTMIVQRTYGNLSDDVVRYDKVALRIILYIPEGGGNGSGGSSGGTNDSSGNDHGNGSGGSSIEVIPGGPDRVAGAIVVIPGNGGSGPSDETIPEYTIELESVLDRDGSFNGKKLGFQMPKSLKEAISNFLNTLWALFTGEISIMDIFGALWDVIMDILENGLDLETVFEVLFYLLLIAIALAVAVIIIYVLIQIFVYRKINNLRRKL